MWGGGEGVVVAWGSWVRGGWGEVYRRKISTARPNSCRPYRIFSVIFGVRRSKHNAPMHVDHAYTRQLGRCTLHAVISFPSCRCMTERTGPSGSGQTGALSGIGLSFIFRPGSEGQPMPSGSGQTAALSGMGLSFTFRLGSEGQPVAFRIRSNRSTEWGRFFLHLSAWLPAGRRFM